MQSLNEYRFLFLAALGSLSLGCELRTEEMRQNDAKQVRKDLGLATEAPSKPSSDKGQSQADSATTGEIDLTQLTGPDAKEEKKDKTSATKPKAPAVETDEPARDWISNATLPREIWEVQYVGNTVVGYERRSASAYSGNQIKIELEARTRVSLNGVAIDQLLTLNSIEERNGDLVKLSGSLKIGDTEQQFEANPKVGSLKIKSTKDGATSESSMEWKEKYRGPFAIEQSLIRKPMKPNQIRKLKYFDPLLGKVVDCQLESEESMLTPTFYGGSRELIAIRNTGTVGELTRESIIWVDSKGQGYKSYLKREDFRSFRTDPVDAQTIAATFELRAIENKATALKGSVDKLHNTTERPKRVVFRIRHPTRGVDKLFASRTSQVVSPSRSSDSVEVAALQIGEALEKIDKLIEEPTADPLALESSKNIPSASRLVVDASKKFSSQFPEGLQPAETMKLFAQTFHKGIAVTEFDNQIQDLATTIRNKRGDCFEHAILLASVGRALTIPCRVAVGAKYNYDRATPEMKLHAWVEFHDGSRWVPVDSTENAFPVPPDRIKFYESYFEHPNPYEGLVGLCTILPELEIEVMNK
jgi:transglutaminase-like putative cysteine protease